jgi:RimJ/RimL family protein N-acetyltransferase
VVDEDVIEMGWGVHHSFGNKGYGTDAVRMVRMLSFVSVRLITDNAGMQIVEKAKETRYWHCDATGNVTLHAFTNISNAASNRMCEKINGFYVKEQCEVDYDDRMLPCNHWCIDI